MTARNRRTLWWGVAILLIAATLRLAASGEIPPGLYHDEAYHGLDVLDILSGRLSLYFPANNGREPLFIYLIAASVGLLGRSPFALRLTSFPIGMLTVATTIALGQELFSRRVGLLAGATLAVTLWHVHLSRVGFRAVLLPLFIALTAWQVALGCRTGHRRHWLTAGLLYGLSLYTYTAARFTPVALAIYALYLALVRQGRRSSVVNLAWAVLAAAVVLAPLGIYTLGHWDIVLGRPGQVSITDPTINGGDLWGTLLAHTLRTLGMFFVRGDRIWRHNVPWRPVFDPLLGAAFVLGLVMALRRVRRTPAAGFVLIWTAVMSMPTLLAEDAPHFLRAVGALPAVVFFPALGLDWLASRVSESASQRIGHLVAILLLLSGLGSTTWAYFGDYAHTPTSGYWFERGAVSLAGRINQFLGSGWNGERMQHGQLAADHQVHLDPLLWAEWQPQLRFLVAAPDQMTTIWPHNSSAPAVAIFAWPYGDWQQAWRLLPSPAEITVEEGPLSQHDRDLQPFTTYLAFFVVPPDPTTPALARFSDGVELLGVEAMPTGDDRLRVRIRWRAAAPLSEEYTIFLHYLRDGERIAQADSQPADGRYPTTQWRPGDVVNDDHYVEGVTAPLPDRDALLFGFWQPESGARLYLLDEVGNPIGDWIEVPVRE
ncbi:MAG TPA: glycosyltransferase family 39 protein [Chloroflexi bacterium]|nr:glycosyltransferase family 39 protein [Chloroflexota bacterium]